MWNYNQVYNSVPVSSAQLHLSGCGKSIGQKRQGEGDGPQTKRQGDGGGLQRKRWVMVTIPKEGQDDGPQKKRQGDGGVPQRKSRSGDPQRKRQGDGLQRFCLGPFRLL